MYSAKELAIARQIKPDIEVAQLDATDLAVLQLVRKATGGGSGVYNATIENGIATFGGVVASSPLVSLLLNIPVTQTGSGTPSPTNIRDFVGFTGAVIGQTSDYGKYFRGLLNGTYGFVDLGSLNWSYDGLFYSVGIRNNVKRPGSNDSIANIACVKYTATSRNDLINNKPDFSIAVNAGGTLQISDSNYSTPGDFIAGVSGVYLIYELAEPSTPVTPQDFATLCQAFGITGNTYQITFGQTVYSAILDVLTGKLYLIDEIKTIDENSGVTASSTNNNVYICDDVFNINEDTESVNCNVYQRGENRQSIAGVFNNNPDLSFCCKLGTYSTRLLIKDTRFTSTEDYNTWLANNPVKIAVKLAEPIEIDLTPTVINTLIGENVIFADVGDITECKYTRK